MQSVVDRILILSGDITRIKADAIVNAANSSLMGGGGVDGAIHRTGGLSILEECKQIVARQGDCPTGEAVITTAGNLPARYVIHTVGPVWYGGDNGEVQKLAACYLHSLQLAVRHNCRTIAFPNISTGVYRFPKAEAASIAIRTVVDFLSHNTTINKVFFVCFEEKNAALIQKEIDKLN